MSRREIVEPTRVRSGEGVHEREVATHPAFGMITANYVSGGAVLHGSDFVHHGFVSVVISEGERHRNVSLSSDSYFARRRKLELRMSESQWAAFVSTMNRGDGVPCTLAWEGGRYFPEIPRPRGEAEAFREEVNARLAALDADMDALTREILEAAGKLSGVRSKKLARALALLRQRIRLGAPWIAKMFDEHMEERMDKAKTEVNAYLARKVTEAGLEALGAVEPPVRLITEGETDE